MDNISNYLQRKIFKLIIFIFLINSSFTYLSFKFPYALKLKNKNILVIHKLGVTICDKTFMEIISTTVTFTESEKIKTEAALSKVASVFVDDYIICLINDNIYIFDEEGNLLKQSEDKITSVTVEYYSLTYTFTKSNYIYFVVGFVYNGKYNLYTYKYQTNEKTIEKYAQLVTCYYSIINNALSCHYMNYYYDYNNVPLLACLYSVDSTGLAIDFLEVTSLSIVSTNKLSSEYVSLTCSVKYIKAVLLPDKENIVVGFINQGGLLYYWKYNINKRIKYNTGYFDFSFCKLKPQGFQITYYSETNLIIYSCLFERNT